MDSWFSRLLNGIVAVVLIVGLVIAIVWAIGVFKAQQDDEASKKGAQNKIPRGTVTLKPPVQKAVETLNLSVVRREIARLRKAEDKLKNAEVSVAKALSELDVERKKAKESRHFAYLKAQDEVLSVQGQELSSMPDAEAADYLQKSFSGIKAKSFFRIKVKRGSAEHTLIAYFLNASDISGVSADLPERVKIPHELGQQVQDEFFSMPEHYRARHLTQEERKRLLRLLGAGEGTPEDYLFIKQRVLGDVVMSIRKEREQFQARLRELKQAIESGYGPNHLVVRMKDGLRVEGEKISGDKNTLILGTTAGQVTISCSDIREQRNVQQLRSNLEFHCYAIDRNASACQPAVKWADEWQLPLHRQYIGFYALAKDPGNELARAAAGYRKDGEGKWVYTGSSTSTALLEPPKTEKDLREYLESRGFAYRSGRWHQRMPWTVKLDTLHKPVPFKVEFKRSGVLERPEGDSPLRTLTGEVDQLKVGERRTERFMGAVSGGNRVGSFGIVTFTIDAPGEIVACQLKANGYVFIKSGVLADVTERLNRITVCVKDASGKDAEVYSIEFASDGVFHDITKHVKGSKRVTVVTTIENTPDKFGTYARFLRSFPETTDVFVVKGQILKPAPEADKLWAQRTP
jgi:hypothetical protein